MKTKKKRGPKASYLVYGGKPQTAIVEGHTIGIQHDAGADTYFCRIPNPEGSWTKRNLSRDRDKAVKKFYELLSHQTEIKTVPAPADNQFYLTDEDGHIIKDAVDGKPFSLIHTENLPFQLQYSEQYLLEQIDRMLENPKELARKLGKEWIADINPIIPKKPIYIKDMLNLYLNRSDKKMTSKYGLDAQRIIDEFMEITKATKASDLTKERIIVYADWLYAVKNKKTYSWAWYNHRVIICKSVWYYAKRMIDDNQDVITAISRWKDVLKTHKPDTLIPRPIDIEDFWNIYDVSPEYFQTILLFCANSASYFKDASDLCWSNLDLKKNTLQMIRVKSGIAKVATLWPETVERLHHIRDSRKDTLPHVFLSFTKGVYTARSMDLQFNRMRAKAGVLKSVKFAGVRDACVTACDYRGLDSRLLLGHRKPGQADAYSLRFPQLMQAACEAIYEYFKVSGHIKK